MLSQIDFEECFDNIPTEGLFKDLAYIVDGVELEIARPNAKADENACFSHKPKMCAVKYEGTRSNDVYLLNFQEVLNM